MAQDSKSFRRHSFGSSRATLRQEESSQFAFRLRLSLPVCPSNPLSQASFPALHHLKPLLLLLPHQSDPRAASPLLGPGQRPYRHRQPASSPPTWFNPSGSPLVLFPPGWLQPFSTISLPPTISATSTTSAIPVRFPRSRTASHVKLDLIQCYPLQLDPRETSQQIRVISTGPGPVYSFQPCTTPTRFHQTNCWLSAGPFCYKLLTAPCWHSLPFSPHTQDDQSSEQPQQSCCLPVRSSQKQQNKYPCRVRCLRPQLCRTIF